MTTSPELVSSYISPAASFSTMDHYMRRELGQEKVVGSILGYISEDGSKVYIKSCFPVPSKSEEGKVDMKFHHSMLQLHKRVYPEDQLIGWYYNGNITDDQVSTIHELYAKETTRAPLLLIVKTSLVDSSQPPSSSSSSSSSHHYVLYSSLQGQETIPCYLLPSDSDSYYLKLLLESNYRPVTMNEPFSPSQSLAHLRKLLIENGERLLSEAKDDPLLLVRLSSALKACHLCLQNKDFDSETFRQDLMMIRYLVRLYTSQLECARKII